LLGTGRQTGNPSADFNEMARHSGVNDSDPLYFLFKLEKKSWLFISYVPPNTKVKDKMLNASAKSQLKAQLGAQFFSDELHTNNKAELSWEFYQGALQPGSALSAGEIEHQRLVSFLLLLSSLTLIPSLFLMVNECILHLLVSSSLPFSLPKKMLRERPEPNHLQVAITRFRCHSQQALSIRFVPSRLVP
jgi:hypothetical protein